MSKEALLETLIGRPKELIRDAEHSVDSFYKTRKRFHAENVYDAVGKLLQLDSISLVEDKVRLVERATRVRVKHAELVREREEKLDLMVDGYSDLLAVEALIPEGEHESRGTILKSKIKIEAVAAEITDRLPTWVDRLYYSSKTFLADKRYQTDSKPGHINGISSLFARNAIEKSRASKDPEAQRSFHLQAFKAMMLPIQPPEEERKNLIKHYAFAGKIARSLIELSTGEESESWKHVSSHYYDAAAKIAADVSNKENFMEYSQKAKDVLL